MNLYVHIINDVVNYIEENISEQMTLQNISRQFCLSEYHFSRLFKVIIGTSLKQYVLGRKLTLALGRLKTSHDLVIDIAYEFGFDYPEVFSRAFKKQFGVSPANFRTGNFDAAASENSLVKKALVVERDIANYQGVLTLKENCIYLDELYLEGVYVEVDENANNFEYLLKSTGDDFLCASQNMEHLEHNRFYSIINCHGDDSGKYTAFFGKEAIAKDGENLLAARHVPGGWYACFTYHGEILDIRSTFVDDLYRWIMIKEIELCSNGVGMLNIFNKQSIQNQEMRILVPIKRP